MYLSRYFMPTLREDPKEAEIVSHRLMLRAGMVRQASAGIYSWLPLGFRVLKNIERIVDVLKAGPNAMYDMIGEHLARRHALASRNYAEFLEL